MAQKALGEVKPTSITIALRATNNETDPTQTVLGQAIQFQALANQTGGVLICSVQQPTTSGASSQVHTRIPPRTNGVDFAWTVGNPGTSGGVNAAEYWILPEVSGEGVRITMIQT